MSLIAWIVIGWVIAVIVLLSVAVVIEYRKVQRQIADSYARFLEANGSQGLQVMRAGLGWVPTNGTLRRDDEEVRVPS